MVTLDDGSSLLGVVNILVPHPHSHSGLVHLTNPEQNYRLQCSVASALGRLGDDEGGGGML